MDTTLKADLPAVTWRLLRVSVAKPVRTERCKGILRLHQFDKVEMESFSLPENGQAEQDFVAIQEYLFTAPSCHIRW